MSKNQGELNRILKLSPIRASAELGKLEATFEKAAPEAKADPKAPTTSKAPVPINPIAGQGAGFEKDPSKMNFRELYEYERAREADKRRR